MCWASSLACSLSDDFNYHVVLGITICNKYNYNIHIHQLCFNLNRQYTGVTVTTNTQTLFIANHVSFFIIIVNSLAHICYIDQSDHCIFYINSLLAHLYEMLTRMYYSFQYSTSYRTNEIISDQWDHCISMTHDHLMLSN